MSLRIGDQAPDFTAETTEGTLHFHEWIGDGWAVLFSHPKDFTPVCTTELGYMAGLSPEFAQRNCKIIGLSIDPVSDHTEWAKDIEESQGHAVNYPLIGDVNLSVAKLYDMLQTSVSGGAQGRTAARPHGRGQRDGPFGVPDRPGQGDQGCDQLSDEHRQQF